MRIISKMPFVEASKEFPRQGQAILDTYNVLKRGSFKDPHELRAVFPSLDNFKYKDKYWVINIGGNHIRLIACILFSPGIIYVKHIVSHAEYDKLTERYRKGEL